jgi:hypothetical protein
MSSTIFGANKVPGCRTRLRLGTILCLDLLQAPCEILTPEASHLKSTLRTRRHFNS